MTNHLRRCLWVLGTVGLLAACVGNGDDGQALTKDDVRGGKGDHTVDYCDYFGWYGDGVCDDFCPHPDSEDCACGDVTCALYCEHGFETDENGCSTCSCNEGPDSCLPVLCELFCENGFAQGDDGCPICSCAEEPRRCGGFAGFICEADEYCDYEPEEMCGAADQIGTCRPRPEVCTQDFTPVCGCDGQTYSNECSANASGVAAASDGECGNVECPEVMCALWCDNGFKTGADGCMLCECNDPDEGQDCGGFAGLTCDADEYCSFTRNAMCGAADQMGTCATRPEVCTQDYTPVCGCDGQTYSNECSANAAGVSTASDGECAAAADCRESGCGEGDYCTFCWGNWACIPDGAVC